MRLRNNVLIPAGILAIGILGALGMIAARSDVETRPSEVPPPLVRSVTVRPETVHLNVSARGVVSPRTETDLIAQVSGQIVETSPRFTNGGFFSKGDVLMRVDPRDYVLAVATAEAQVAQAEVRMAREVEEAEVAKQEWGRVGAGEPTPLVLREPQMAEARAALAAARAGLERARLNLERTVIRAPYDGRVRTKRVDVGQVVGPAAPLGRVYAADYVEIRLPVPDPQLEYLDLTLRAPSRDTAAAGPLVTFTSEFAGRSNRWTGRIVRAEGEVDPRTRMVTLVGRVEAPYAVREDGSHPLSVGLFVNADIAGRQVDGAVVLPRAALRGMDQVLVIEDERLRFRTIGILRTTDESIIVTAGLEPGERVCVSPLDAVIDGMRVRSSVEVEGGQG